MTAILKLLEWKPAAAMVCLLLQACAGTAPDSRINLAEPLSTGLLQQTTALFGPRPDIPTPEMYHQLTSVQLQEFNLFFHDPIRAGIAPHRRLLNYMDSKILGFDYRGETLSAAESMSNESGNCLSLAILTTSLAHAAGVEIGYQLMNDEPVYVFNGSLVEKGVHVRAILLDPEWDPDSLGLWSRGIAIDYFPTRRTRFIRNLTQREYIAMYYRNIANDALVAEEFDRAYWYIRESLLHAPDSAESLNALAVIHRRAGYADIAEQIYLHGIEHARDKLTLLKNYKVLLLASGRSDEAQAIDQRLLEIPDPSPFSWFQLGQASLEEGDFDHAVVYFNKALQMAPYLHEAHLGLARIHYEQGQTDQAIASLKIALEFASRGHRDFYHAKLASFEREL